MKNGVVVPGKVRRLRAVKIEFIVNKVIVIFLPPLLSNPPKVVRFCSSAEFEQALQFLGVRGGITYCRFLLDVSLSFEFMNIAFGVGIDVSDSFLGTFCVCYYAYGTVYL